jgi:hypothetical protein
MRPFVLELPSAENRILSDYQSGETGMDWNGYFSFARESLPAYEALVAKEETALSEVVRVFFPTLTHLGQPRCCGQPRSVARWLAAFAFYYNYQRP